MQCERKNEMEKMCEAEKKRRPGNDKLLGCWRFKGLRLLYTFSIFYLISKSDQIKTKTQQANVAILTRYRYCTRVCISATAKFNAIKLSSSHSFCLIFLFVCFNATNWNANVNANWPIHLLYHSDSIAQCDPKKKRNTKFIQHAKMPFSEQNEKKKLNKKKPHKQNTYGNRLWQQITFHR